MEAVPKLPLISFELKTSTETAHFGPKLKQFIAEVYKEDPDSYSNEIHQLEGLRSTAVRPTIDASGRNALTRYYCQLRALQSRFPMAKGQPAAVTFAWKDLYANMTCTLPDIRFEIACVLYNIGAIHTNLGASEPRTTADSMKAACTHYQNAAWAFKHLREQFTQPPGVDLASDIMKLLEEICFAQAQECILEKSIQDTKKPSVIGAVGTQVYLFYKSSLAILGPSTGTDNIHEIIGTKLYNYWYRYLSFKKAYIGCILCLYQGMHAEEQQKMGERVAFYQLAGVKLADARKLAKYIEPVQITQEALTFTNDVVEGKRKAAKNENEFIYHEEVPDRDLLQKPKPVCLVKALQINFSDPEVTGREDIFAKLVPMRAHEAASVYSEEKAKLLRQVVTKAEEKDSELLEFMSSLQLDQLDILDADQTIPQEIVDRCAAMNAKTEVIQTLVDSMNNLAEIISDVEHSLAEIKSLIQEETQKEKDFQKIMGPRPPSIVQTELSREFHKYQEAHNRTNESNQVLHKAMTLHIANLKLLALPLDELQSKIPSIENIEGLDRDTMTAMKRVVAAARQMQVQRNFFLQKFREEINSDDITPHLLLKGSSETNEEIFKEQLKKFSHRVKLIEQNLAAQENVINQLTSLYASYGESRRLLSDVLRKREGLINALITSYDTYEELLGKSQKGLEFYKKLWSNVGQLLSRLRSTCQVQREERAQLLDTHTNKGAAAVSAELPGQSTKLTEGAPLSSGGSLKLKDYLPYMKGRGMGRATPQAPVEPATSEAYYPESIYPTSVRPAPVGSEATDLNQMKLPDGITGVSGMNQYNRMGQYAPSGQEMYYGYQKPYEKPDDFNYTSYTPQFSSQGTHEPQYSNPQYAGSQNSPMLVTDSQNVLYSGSNTNANPSQYMYDAHGQKLGSIPEVSTSAGMYNQNQVMNQQSDLNVNFGQMQIGSKSEQNMPSYSEYSSQNYYNQYPNASTTPMSTYSHAPQNSATSITPSQTPSEFSNSYPYTSETPSQYPQQGIPQPGVSQPGMSQPGMSQPGMPQPGLSQPGMSQPGLSQAGMSQGLAHQGMTQPGMSQPGMSQPGMPQPTILQGMQQPGLSQPGMSHPGMSQPGMSQPGVSQPGMSQGLAQQGMLQPVMSQPGVSQQELPQPMMSQLGTSQPGMSQSSTPYSASNQTITQSYPDQTVNPAYSMPNQQYSYHGTVNQDISQGYTVYSNAESAETSTTNVFNTPVTVPNVPTPYSFEPDPKYDPATLAQLDALDQPIKSHVTGEALSAPMISQNYQNYDPHNVKTEQYTPTQPNSQNSAQNYQNYDSNTMTVKPDPNNPNQYTTQQTSQIPPQNYQTNYVFVEPSFANYSTTQSYQNHPGYTYNSATGNYDYNYGSQTSNQESNGNQTGQEQNWAPQGVYTSAGEHQTVQSPSENGPTSQPSNEQTNNQLYYNSPYGYLTTTNQSGEITQNTTPNATNYGANVNQSTYMQSGEKNTSVTFSNNQNQVTTPVENVNEQPNFGHQNFPSNEQSTGYANKNSVPQNIEQTTGYANKSSVPQNIEQSTTGYVNQNDVPQNIQQNTGYGNQNSVPKNIEQSTAENNNVQNTPITPKQEPKEIKSEPVESKEPTTFDLLSDIDFTVEIPPLKPEIKVPQISESAFIKRPIILPKEEPESKKVIKEEVIERPAKKDLFSDPSLLNQFTEEVKNLQKLVDSLANKAAGGLTVLDAKWKTFQDSQSKDNMSKTKHIARKHSGGNIVTEVVPYDDTRLMLKSDPDAYINASYYKQLAPWCIPLAIAKSPTEMEYSIFWKAVLENKITCVLCLQSEIETQGKTYWPTAKGQTLELDDVKVTLDEVNCTVHYTERKLTVSCGKTTQNIVHYQINVFPAKIVCSPLVLLADKVLSQTYDNRLSNQLTGALIQCGSGAGRSALMALLILAMCQVRAGQIQLCDMLDAGCIGLCRNRANVLEDTKCLAAAYRTVLFYVQGVLCSGTTMFNGEAVSVPMDASFPAPPTSIAAPSGGQKTQKFSRESFEEMKQSPGLTSGDIKDPLNFLDPLWSLKKKS